MQKINTRPASLLRSTMGNRRRVKGYFDKVFNYVRSATYDVILYSFSEGIFFPGRYFQRETKEFIHGKCGSFHSVRYV